MKTLGRLFYAAGACIFAYAYVMWFDKLSGSTTNIHDGLTLYDIQQRCSGPPPRYSAASCADMLHDHHGYLPYLCAAVVSLSLGRLLNKRAGDVVGKPVARWQRRLVDHLAERKRRNTVIGAPPSSGRRLP